MPATPSTRSRRLRRRALLAAAAIGTLAAPAAADAQLYCVGTQSCYLGSTKATFAEALDAAANNAGNDIIRLGPGTFSGSHAPGGAGEVTILGAGRGDTILQHNVDSGAVFLLPGGSLQNLTVKSSATTALEVHGGLVRNVDATTTALGGKSAIRLTGPAQLENVTAKAPSGLALRASCVADCSIRDSDLEGLEGIRAIGGARLTVDGVRVRGGGSALGASDPATHVTVRRSLLTSAGPQAGGAVFGEGATASLRHVTIARSGAGAGYVGLGVIAKDGQASAVVAEGVAVAGYDNHVWRAADGAPADLTLRGSAWDRSKENVGAANGPGVTEIDSSNVNLAGRSAGFTDALAGDFKPRPDSPLLDGVPGAPPAGFVDLAGAPATDGDGNGVVQADIGALEGATGQPQQPPPGGGGGEQPPVGGEEPPVGEQPPAGTQPDTLAPRLSSLTAKKRARTIRVAFRLSEPGTVALRIERRRGRRFVALARNRTLKAVAGRNKATLRLKSLPRGTYRVVAQPTDAAGNRGKRRRASVR